MGFEVYDRRRETLGQLLQKNGFSPADCPLDLIFEDEEFDGERYVLRPVIYLRV